jgi:transcriptional regulator with XRE-family HTH domain
MDIAATIRRARERLGLSQTELARRLRVSKTAVAKWEIGETAPKRKRAQQVARVLGLSESELLAHANVGLTLVDDETGARMIPLMCLNDVPVSGFTTNPEEFSCFPKVLADVGEDETAIALKVTNAEMAGEINDGDVVIVSAKVDPRADDVVVASVDNEILLRRYIPRGRDSSGQIVFDLMSPNPDVATRTVNASHPGRVLAVVVERRHRRQP